MKKGWIYSLENILQPIDIAEGLKKLYDLVVTTNPKLSIYQFALELQKEIGLHEASIRRYLSLVNLTPELKEMVSDGKITIESAERIHKESTVIITGKMWYVGRILSEEYLNYSSECKKEEIEPVSKTEFFVKTHEKLEERGFEPIGESTLWNYYKFYSVYPDWSKLDPKLTEKPSMLFYLSIEENEERRKELELKILTSEITKVSQLRALIIKPTLVHLGKGSFDEYIDAFSNWKTKTSILLRDIDLLDKERLDAVATHWAVFIRNINY